MEKLILNFKDEMTPLERMTAMGNGKPFDRIPCVPLLGEPSTRLIGATVSKYHKSSDIMVASEIAAFNRFGHDSIGIGPEAYGISEAMGANVVFPNDNIPYIKSPYIEDYSMLNMIEPVNPYNEGRLPLYLEASKILREKAKDIVGVGCGIAGPFTIAAYLRGTENILRDIHKSPENLHKLLKIVTESCKNCIDAFSINDVGIGISDPLASGTVIGPKAFREFVKSYFIEIINEVIKKTGKKLHCIYVEILIKYGGT